MSTQKLSNISVAKFQAFLELVQCKWIKTEGSHEKWTRADLLRPVIFQSTIDPVPEFIVRNNLRVLGYGRKEFFEVLGGKKTCKREKDRFYLTESKS